MPARLHTLRLRPGADLPGDAARPRLPLPGRLRHRPQRVETRRDGQCESGPKFLYAIGNHINGVVDGPAGQHAVHQQLTTHVKPVASFVFNSATGEFFWSSPGFGLIGMRNVHQPRTESNVMWLRDLARPAELALDWRAGNLYYSSQTSSDIAVCSTAHRLCRQLLSAPGAAVTRIAVDPPSGRLFVAVIGAEKTDLVSGLALDPVKQLVFWSESDRLT